jgi:hypothetical protein
MGRTPSDIIKELNKEINAALADPKVKARTPRNCRRKACRKARTGRMMMNTAPNSA